MEASRAESQSGRESEPYLSISRLRPAEYVGFLAAAVLFGSLFLPWWSTTGTATIEGRTGTFNAFEAYNTLDWLLVAACLAPFILAFIIARGHKLSWRPGEVTSIVGITAFVLIFCNGVVFGKPGNPNSEILYEVGWFVGLVGAAGFAASGFVRQLEGTTKKPPGV